MIVSPDANNFLNPKDYFHTGPFFAFSRIICPIWAFLLTLSALHKFIRFVQFQGPKLSSLAQLTMFSEFVANLIRGFINAMQYEYCTSSQNLWGQFSEGLAVCNQIMAAVFWGTLDTNSSPLYRFRYPLFVLCGSFLIINSVLIQYETTDLQTWVNTVSLFWSSGNCGVSCLVVILVVRRLLQLSKYKVDAPVDQEKAEAGDEASKEQEAEEGQKHRPIVKKLLFWSVLLFLNAIVGIVTLILLQIHNDIASTERNNPAGFTNLILVRGICPLLQSSLQLMLFMPKPRQSGQSTVGSQAGTMTK